MKKLKTVVSLVLLLCVAAGLLTQQPSDHHILIVSISAAGHYLPLLVVADKLANLGFEVTFASESEGLEAVKNEKIRKLSFGEKSDLITEEQMETIREKLSDKEDGRKYGFSLFEKALNAEYPTLFKTLASWKQHLNGSSSPTDDKSSVVGSSYPRHFPSVILHDFATFSGLAVARDFEIPAISVGFYPNRNLDLFALPGVGDFELPPLPLFKKLSGIYDMLSFLKDHLVPIANEVQRLREQEYPKVGMSIDAKLKNLSPPDVIQSDVTIYQTVVGLEYQIAPKLDEVFVGPLIPSNLGSEPEIENWLQGAPHALDSKPVVYIAFGTLVVLNEYQAQQIAVAVENLVLNTEWRVLWALRAEKEQQKVYKNFSSSFYEKFIKGEFADKFRISKWIPQMLVLSHPNVKVFMSHCGGNGLHESLYFGKPLLAVPFYADQLSGSAKLVMQGAGIRVNKDTFTSNELVQALEKIRTNDTFTREARRLSVLMKAAGGVDQVITVIETVILAGTTHLKPYTDSIALYHRYNLDVYAVLASPFLIAAWIIFKLYQCCRIPNPKQKRA